MFVYAHEREPRACARPAVGAHSTVACSTASPSRLPPSCRYRCRTNLYWHPFWLRLGESADGELAHSQKHLNIVLDGGEETAEQQAVRASSLFDQRGKPLPRALQGLAALGQAAKPRHALQISVYDHERYFFFQRLSTVGALMLLAVHGPGRAAVDSEPSGAAPLSRLMRVVKGED